MERVYWGTITPETYDQAMQTYGSDPLHKTVLFGHTENLTFLLERGMSPNTTNFDCLTPLHIACMRNRIDCARILVKYGANINASGADGGTPLCDACAVGSADCVHLLLQEGADVNPVLALSTPLHEACARGSLTCVSLLIQAGAILNTNDCHIGTPLHTATLRNHFDCARLLLQSGAPVNAVKIHETPLHIAARENHLDLARLLLQYGANVYASNNQNKLPIDLLQENKGPFYDLLIHYSSFPPTLKDICRRKIRIALGSERLKFLPDLEIPRYNLDILKESDQDFL
ncbi:hypothetical protein TNCT_626741 [Trichonephila clavata]|uniref:SOCS box domain-containing protein n=2 Tax=Trichonephila clavata TaxID=2740835 RepID=A0A8X6IJ75_TRICU|nr:hypothetical protein TNCT_626741 [Trichonephila clavata]